MTRDCRTCRNNEDHAIYPCGDCGLPKSGLPDYEPDYWTIEAERDKARKCLDEIVQALDFEPISENVATQAEVLRCIARLKAGARWFDLFQSRVTSLANTRAELRDLAERAGELGFWAEDERHSLFDEMEWTEGPPWAMLWFRDDDYQG